MQHSSSKSSWRSRWLARLSLVAGLLSVASCSQDSPAPSPGVNNPGGCTAPAQACNGACVNVSADPTNCGACGVKCSIGQSCQAGRCAVSCTSPQVECNSMCADTASNALHCGGCGRACTTGQICQNSACVTGSCPAGQTLCAGACVDVLTSPTSCGACGVACSVGQSCQAGACVTPGAGGSAGSGSGGTAGASTTGGTAGLGTTGGTAGMSAGGTAGTGVAGTGGDAGMSTGGTAGSGTAGTGTAGTMSAGGAGAGGSAGTNATGGGGAGPGVSESASCPKITWPTSTGTTNLGSGTTVSGVYDGGMKIHEGNLEDCSTGDQDSVDPLIEVADGGTVKNVIMGNRVGDGIHCLGSCTLENVWFPNVCDDAISIMGSGTVTIKNSGFKNARDKTIQHNGTATVTIDNVYVETAGKLYRSCGEGCSSSTSRTATIQNVVAIGVDQVAGVSTRDTVTLKNICVHRTFSICSIYDPGTSDETETGVNSSNEGPNANCKFTGADTHALLSKVSGIPFTTDSVCGGPNGYKSGSTATNCVAGFDKCLKACMPGGYGFKEITCGSNGRYAEGTGAICAFPTDQTAAMNLAQSRVMAASAQEENNGECSTLWGIALEESNNANYCVCVKKPGYYSHDNWLSWDCQRKWW